MELKLSVMLWKLWSGVCRIRAQIQRIAKLCDTIAIWSSSEWFRCILSNDSQHRSLKEISDSPFGMLTKDGSSLHWFQTSGQFRRISLPVIPSNEPRFNSIKPGSRLIGIPVIDDMCWETCIVRFSGLEYSAVNPHLRDALAVANAWEIPMSFNGMSICPWNLPSLFHCVSPWRTR